MDDQGIRTTSDLDDSTLSCEINPNATPRSFRPPGLDEMMCMSWSQRAPPSAGTIDAGGPAGGSVDGGEDMGSGQDGKRQLRSRGMRRLIDGTTLFARYGYRRSLSIWVVTVWCTMHRHKTCGLHTRLSSPLDSIDLDVPWRPGRPVMPVRAPRFLRLDALLPALDGSDFRLAV
jgi:hypothetical protein